MTYLNLPWRDQGTDRSGLDCRGLAALWLREQKGFTATYPRLHAETDELAEAVVCQALVARHSNVEISPPSSTLECRATRPMEPGDVVFFRARRTGQVRHVAIYLGEEGYLHILKGSVSRVDKSLALMHRIGLDYCGHLGLREAEALALALSDRKLGGWTELGLLLLSVAMSAASGFLMPKPKIGTTRAQTGRYSFDQLVTRSDPTLPLPDVLGAVVVAGNSPYQSLVDKSQPATDATQQKINKVVILASGPIEGVDYDSQVIKINGRVYTDKGWHPDGFALNPAQTKAEAVDGTIGSAAARPSISVYLGTPGTTVPVDVRAQYDRNFPLYGFNGCAYVVLRLIDSAKFSQFNLTVPVKGRKCRTFDANGFTRTTVTSEAVGTGDGTTTRFKLAFEDLATVTTVTVAGVTYVEASETQQRGTVYRLNKVKGYLEFFTAPAAAAAVVCTYAYYPRAWTQNPVTHTTYLLTEPVRGKGLDESRLAWDRAVAARDYCDEKILWQSAGTALVETRHTSNYSLDYLKPIQDHLRVLLDACYAYLFVSDGKFVIKPRRDESSVFSFTPANILQDSFSAEQVDRAQRANRVQVFFHSSDTYNAEADVIRDDEDDQRRRTTQAGNDGVVEEILHLQAVDRRSHAERLAELILRENVSSRWVAAWKTTILGLALEPGDIVDVTHPARSTWTAKKMRIEELTHDDQDRIALRLSEYVPHAYL